MRHHDATRHAHQRRRMGQNDYLTNPEDRLESSVADAEYNYMMQVKEDSARIMPEEGTYVDHFKHDKSR